MDSAIHQREGMESRYPAIKGDSRGGGVTSLKPKKGRPRIDAQIKTAAQVRRVCCLGVLIES